MIADFVIIIVMALCVLLGYIRGLIKVTVKIIGLFAALIIALIFYTPVSNYIINNTTAVASLSEAIVEKIYSKEEADNLEENTINSVENNKEENNVDAQMQSYVKDDDIYSIMQNLNDYIGGNTINLGSNTKTEGNYDIMQNVDDYIEETKYNGARYIAGILAVGIIRVRNMDRIIFNSKNINAVYKIICKCNRENTSNKAI